MRHVVARSLLVTTLTLTAIACTKQPREERSTGRVVKDVFERRVRVPSSVQRIVSLAPSTTEIVFALGAGDRLVGVDQFSDYPAAALAVPKVGSNIEPSIERILGMRPDVVLAATSANRQSTTEEMEKLGLAVIVTRGDSLEQIFADIGIVGAAIGLTDAAAALVQKLRADLAAVQQKSATLPKTSCAIIVWPEPLVVAGPGSHLDALLAIAGGTNIAGDAGQPFPSYSQERLIARAPQVLVYGTHKTQKPPDISALEKLTSIPAIRDKRVHLADGDLLFRPGPRIVEGAATLFSLLHPEARP